MFLRRAFEGNAVSHPGFIAGSSSPVDEVYDKFRFAENLTTNERLAHPPKLNVSEFGSDSAGSESESDFVFDDTRSESNDRMQDLSYWQVCKPFLRRCVAHCFPGILKMCSNRKINSDNYRPNQRMKRQIIKRQNEKKDSWMSSARTPVRQRCKRLILPHSELVCCALA